jgi:Transmembrane protein of unknown function (DUF3556)
LPPTLSEFEARRHPCRDRCWSAVISQAFCPVARSLDAGDAFFADEHVTPLNRLRFVDAPEVALMAVIVIAIALGNLHPPTVSFLPGMRYYAGNWDISTWCLTESATEKIHDATRLVDAINTSRVSAGHLAYFRVVSRREFARLRSSARFLRRVRFPAAPPVKGRRDAALLSCRMLG